MKVVFFSFLISIGWHLIFLFLIHPLFYKVEFPKPPLEVKFLGQIVESAKVEFSSVKLKEEFLFLDSVFTPVREEKDFLSRRFSVDPKLRMINFSPEFKKINLEKYIPQGYLILKGKVSPDLPFKACLDEFSNPGMVEIKILTGEIQQDFENWFMVKSMGFYSPGEERVLSNE